MSLLINELTKKQLDSYFTHPNNGMLIVGPRGSGKTALLKFAASKLLSLEEEKLENYPHILFISAASKQLISIDQIRDIDHFLARKVPGKTSGIKRLVLIDDSEYMTTQAQNALLKNLEEPPDDTAFILSTSDQTKLLPTVRSRILAIRINKPNNTDLENYLRSISSDQELIAQAISISGGLIGLAVAIVSQSAEHPLVKAATAGRQIISSKTYERLLLVNQLSKDTVFLKNTLGLIKLMAEIALKTAEDNQARKWYLILDLTYETEQKLVHNTNTKLNLTNFMLSMP